MISSFYGFNFEDIKVLLSLIYDSRIPILFYDDLTKSNDFILSTKDDFLKSNNKVFAFCNIDFNKFIMEESDKNIFVFKDFYNSFYDFKMNYKNFDQNNFIDLWIYWAKYLLNNDIDNKSIFLNFNSFLKRIDYRIQFLQKFNTNTYPKINNIDSKNRLTSYQKIDKNTFLKMEKIDYIDKLNKSLFGFSIYEIYKNIFFDENKFQEIFY